ncbi:MAG: glycosyltransferase family A protein [Thermoproteota archaeon]|jgi:glycosyltransferase involved in cell wall biosynthesis|nr:glycosyltransferase family A protein [Thermoproteota archaeon]
MNTINQPKVTVIIVAYNAEGMKNIFKQCLDSTLNLKYDNYEVIVVNNGSTDKTREILEDYEKTIINDEDINRSARKFVISR